MHLFTFITFLLNIVLILQIEILPWSVMRIKGLAFCPKNCVSNGIGTRLVNVRITVTFHAHMDQGRGTITQILECSQVQLFSNSLSASQINFYSHELTQGKGKCG